MGKSAIILGATGLTGEILLKKLVANPAYETIKLFSRSHSTVTSPKIVEFIVDLQNPASFSKDFTADEVFCCIGTTASKTADKQQYKNIDFGIPVTVAKLSKQQNIPTFIVMSSMGANASSTVFYSKIKGEMEAAVLLQNIEKTHILRPSLIGGDRTEFRFGEKIAKVAMGLLSPLLVGGLQKYKMIHPEKIANCMITLANSDNKQVIFSSDEIENIANSTV